MIDKMFWMRIADNWSKDDDSKKTQDDKMSEDYKTKATQEKEGDFSDEISNDEIYDILADLHIDDID